MPDSSSSSSRTSKAAASRAASSRTTEDDKRADNAGDSSDSAREAEENQRLSKERAAAVFTSTANAAVPVDDTAVSQPPSVQPATHTDRVGVERITSGTDTDGWEPAPTDPHPSQVEAAEERNAKFDEESKERQSSDSDKANA
jgi:hypothetical protein